MTIVISRDYIPTLESKTLSHSADMHDIVSKEITSWLSIAVPSIIGSLLYVPWCVKDGFQKYLGFAPLWSHRFDQIPGAKIDKIMVVVVVLIIALLSAVISSVIIR